MKRRYFWLILLVCLLFSGCAYRKAYKQAVKYEAAQMYNLAVEKYLFSLSKKPTFTDSQIGLMRSATIYKSQLEDEIERAYRALDDDKVVNTYLTLDNICTQAASYKVELEIGSRTKGQYEESKGRFLTNHYTTAQQLMDEEKFGDAEKQLQTIVKVDPTYRDSKKMLVVSKCEPIYRIGTLNMESRKFRTAYNQFQKILTIDGNYKDTRELLSEALEHGMLTIAFTPTSNEWRYKNFCNLLRTKTTQIVQQRNDPFYRIVDLNNTDYMLREQKKALQYGLDMKAGAVIPVRAHLNYEILQMQLVVNQPKLNQKKGYIKETKKDKSIVYHKVYYTEYTRSQKCQGNITFTLKSTETGLTLTSGSSYVSSNDQIAYVYYSGNIKGTLYSGTWENQRSASESDKVYYSLESQMNARRNLKSEEEMQKELTDKVANDIARTILNYRIE